MDGEFVASEGLEAVPGVVPQPETSIQSEYAAVQQRVARRAAFLAGVRISEGAREKLLYAGAAASYIVIGVFVTEFVLSWVTAFAWLLLWVWGLPALVRRLRS